MTIGIANGHAHVGVEEMPGRSPSQDQASAADGWTRAAVHVPLTSTQDRASELYRALATSQQQVIAGLQRIDTLLKKDELREQQLCRLAEAVAQAHRSSHYDALTGLPNRILLLDRFQQAAARGSRQHKQVALLFLDIDRFKHVNDALGHTAGDQLLQQVAARLTASIRTSDTACRYGGDEFVILLPEIEHRESALAVMEKIRAHLAAPYAVAGTAILVTASIGVAVYPTDGTEYTDLIRQSDAAMYMEKYRGPEPLRSIERAQGLLEAESR